MAKYTRANAWNNGGTFNNTDLLWYAKGVCEMQARKLDDPSSWWFFAAIHGQYLTPESLKDPDAFPWKNISGPPKVPVAPLPAKSISDRFWNQCQHQSWYFVPWHRGYLLALEAQIRTIVIKLGGPSTWALPYWNYLGPNDEYKIPPAFAQQNLPDGNPNPLYVTARYGPDFNGNIYVPTREVIKQHPHDPNFIRGPVTQDSLTDTPYTGGVQGIPPGFGGPPTVFSHGGGTSGGLEGNPHNVVHIYVGSQSKNGIPGLMSDPGIAGLDPIFYVHHANIDRLWAVWNQQPANTNPPEADWLNGPTANGKDEFVMPMPDGGFWVYTPREMSDLNKLNYTYDDMPKPAPALDLLARRLTRLGATDAASKMSKGAAVTPGKNVELVGANQESLPIKSAGASTSVQLDPGVNRRMAASLERASETALPDRVFLSLENVRGSQDASVLSVFINLPEGAKPADHPELMAGTVGLFGLHSASLKEGKHGGQGLNFVLDISRIVDTLHLNNALGLNSLRVSIMPAAPVPDKAKITIGRVSIYRQGQ
jgi:tyrosinase